MLPFSLCEEAFLLKNVQNVIDVWARGSGLARLNFCARNGQAELQLFYQLGHPEASHLPHQPPAPPAPDLSHPSRPTRHKSQRRILKDRRRAAEFQARRRAENSSDSHDLPTTSTNSPIPSSTNTPQAAFNYMSSSVTTSSSNLDSLLHMLPQLYLAGCDQPKHLPITTTSSRSSYFTPQTATNSTCSPTSTTQAVTSPVISPMTVARNSSTTPSQAVTSLSSCPNTTSQAVTSFSCSTTQAVVTPVVSPLQAVTTPAGGGREDQFTMDTMPQQEGYCCECEKNFDFPCYASPCLGCGFWYHTDCYDKHSCSDVSDGDDSSDQDLDV